MSLFRKWEAVDIPHVLQHYMCGKDLDIALNRKGIVGDVLKSGSGP